MTSEPGFHRLTTMSPTGRFVVMRQKHGVQIADALGTAPRSTIRVDALTDFLFVGNQLWIVDGTRLRRFSPGSARELGAPTELGAGAGRLLSAQAEQTNSALWHAGDYRFVTVTEDDVLIDELDLGESSFATSLGGQRLLVGAGKTVQVRDAGGSPLTTARLPNGGAVAAAGNVLGGRAVGVLTRSRDSSSLVVFRPNGALVHDIKLPPSKLCAIADNRGLALVYTEAGKLLSVDVRFGRILGQTDPPIPIEDMAIDVAGKYIAIAGFRADDTLAVLHLAYSDLFGGRSREAGGAKATEADGASTAEDAAEVVEREPEETEAEAEETTGPVVIPDVHLAALGRTRALPAVRASFDAPPYADAIEHLVDLLDMVAARAARCIADAWDSGRLSMPTDDSLPFETEVLALTGGRAGGAAELLSAADARLGEISIRIGRRQQATLAAGRSLPFIEISQEFGLSALASRVLLLIAAPALRGEVARLYGILANDEARPVCDRHLVQLILAGDDKSMRHQVAAELDSESALVRHGLVQVGNRPTDTYLFAPLSCDPVMLSRLRGDRDAGAGPGSSTTIRRASVERLRELAMPEQLKRDLVLSLAGEPPADAPVRVLLRGRPGAGRRTLAAALAARAERPAAIINAERLPRQAVRFATALRSELRRAGMRGAVPCISNIEVMDTSDAEGVEAVRSVLRAHPGPILFRTSPEHKPPLEPGYLDFTIPPLSETERLGFWQEALARRGMTTERADALAARFRIGPGTIETVIDVAAARREAMTDPDPDPADDLDTAARQHIATRLGNVATHIKRLADWDQVALPADVLDSIREFLGRVKHRRTVYEEWGYDARMSSSRGLTALFHGPPGTGKSMVAGLIANELGLDLYRVDLAQITSKWIGETEKNLAEVFDAAEDGQCVILFDEADSLFAKRTEVKSSVDRYANLEVNYLLQRLDTFEGVAILTTNLEGSLDTAFKRRLSLRLAFPFPDEEMRVRLWHAHIPPEVPTAGDFDFEDLAKKFPMSGGYIRNSALRAAFLAAQEGVPLSQQHIVRAIHLEYREMGKLSTSGRIE
jgi:AAA+ superfamily predicted ATPase